MSPYSIYGLCLQVNENNELAKERQKKYYKLKRLKGYKSYDFRVGQKVMKANPKKLGGRKGDRMTPDWLSGYIIVELCGQKVILRNESTGQVLKGISLVHIKPFLERETPATVAPPVEQADMQDNLSDTGLPDLDKNGPECPPQPPCLSISDTLPDLTDAPPPPPPGCSVSDSLPEMRMPAKKARHEETTVSGPKDVSHIAGLSVISAPLAASSPKKPEGAPPPSDATTKRQAGSSGVRPPPAKRLCRPVDLGVNSEAILHGQEWLNDDIIDKAQSLLATQFPHVDSLQSVCLLEAGVRQSATLGSPDREWSSISMATIG